MEARAAYNEIHATLHAKGFKSVGPGTADYEGKISVHGKEVDIRIEISDVSFVNLPKVSLSDPRQIPLEVLAHIVVGKRICYHSAAGLPLDIYKPGEAILRILEDARSTLELSYKGRAVGEIVDEYQHYWKSAQHARVLVSRSDFEKKIHTNLFLIKDSEPFFWAVVDDIKGIKYNNYSEYKSTVYKTNANVGPIKGLIKPDNLVTLKKWLECQNKLFEIKWNDVISELEERKVVFISAGNAFIGFQIILPKDITTGLKNKSIRKSSLGRIIDAKMSQIGIRRWSAKWSDIGTVTKRNNEMNKNLSHLKIALIGCGTIGSYLARMLVQSGAGSINPLQIYDADTLAIGNIGRHLLNFADIDKPKADALAVELRRFHPQVSISPHSVNALAQWDALASCDLVIDATGDWNVQSALNDLFLNNAHNRPSAILHSWVFMNGDGVQSFLNLGDEKACFRCLRSDMAGPWRFPASKQNGDLTLMPATCGDGVYIPFTVDVPIIAASLANRAALDWANGKPDPRLKTVATDMERGRFHKPCSPDPAKNCPACSGLRSPK